MKRNISNSVNAQTAKRSNRLFIAGLTAIVVVVFCVTSCRPQSDNLLSYGQDDFQAFYDANNSFTGEFVAFWTAMNENYGIWDYEESFGTNWDEVYRTYLPKFEELDKRRSTVTNEELKALYEQITDTLHDGHLSMSIKNLNTGKYINLDPNGNRVARERWQELQDVSNNLTDLHLYCTPAAGAYQVLEYNGVSSHTIVFALIDTTLTHAIKAVDAYMARVEAAGGPNSTNDSVCAAALRLKVDAQEVLNILHEGGRAVLIAWKSIIFKKYNAIYTNYDIVGRQIGALLPPLEEKLTQDALGSLDYALFEGNIAYLRIGQFGLYQHLEQSSQSQDSASLYFAYQQAVKRVWKRWFDAIQLHHKAGDLGGVIIDVRNNPGGAVSDYQWVLGALLPSGGWQSHTLRVKNGVGRLDYGPLTPFNVATYEGEHEVINDRPIVVLANCKSVSMAENTTYGVKAQPNGCFIGTRTSGGLSALMPYPNHYSDHYTGAFGVENVTPIYGYVPKLVCMFPDEKGVLRIMEGHGFDPDIECPLDVNLWKSAGRDNQLEKAVDYIQGK